MDLSLVQAKWDREIHSGAGEARHQGQDTSVAKPLRKTHESLTQDFLKGRIHLWQQRQLHIT